MGVEGQSWFLEHDSCWSTACPRAKPLTAGSLAPVPLLVASRLERLFGVRAGPPTRHAPCWDGGAGTEGGIGLRASDLVDMAGPRGPVSAEDVGCSGAAAGAASSDTIAASDAPSPSDTPAPLSASLPMPATPPRPLVDGGHTLLALLAARPAGLFNSTSDALPAAWRRPRPCRVDRRAFRTPSDPSVGEGIVRVGQTTLRCIKGGRLLSSVCDLHRQRAHGRRRPGNPGAIVAPALLAALQVPTTAAVAPCRSGRA